MGNIIENIGYLGEIYKNAPKREKYLDLERKDPDEVVIILEKVIDAVTTSEKYTKSDTLPSEYINEIIESSGIDLGIFNCYGGATFLQSHVRILANSFAGELYSLLQEYAPDEINQKFVNLYGKHKTLDDTFNKKIDWEVVKLLFPISFREKEDPDTLLAIAPSKITPEIIEKFCELGTK